jgi:Arc/MetJ-type ribon-helix-helix transcriptional regulator
VAESRVRRTYSITESQAEWLREQAHRRRVHESDVVRAALRLLMADPDEAITEAIRKETQA